MWKLIGLTCTVMFLFLFAKPKDDRFLKYKVVETYEVRPGILMMPRYSGDGQVCEIVIEKHHYSNETAILDSTIPRELIMQIVDELVPPNERGSLTINTGSEFMSEYSGNSVTTFAEYKNVSIDIVGMESPLVCAGDIVVLIRWKNRKCQ